MKKSVLIVAVVTALLACAPARGRDKEPNPADYPTQFRVSNTITTNSFMIGNFCTMALIDPANPGLIIVVQKHGYGKCHVWDAGTVFTGRRAKNDVEILVKDDKDKLRVERWSVASTATIAPPPAKMAQ
jgi:hypothetical protein